MRMNKKEGSMSYDKYLQSESWKKTKERYRNSKRKQHCWCCNDKSKPVDLHHKNYKRLGRERLSDLVALCRECHYEVHEVARENGNSNGQCYKALKTIKKRRQRENMSA